MPTAALICRGAIGLRKRKLSWFQEVDLSTLTNNAKEHKVTRGEHIDSPNLFGLISAIPQET